MLGPPLQLGVRRMPQLALFKEWKPSAIGANSLLLGFPVPQLQRWLFPKERPMLHKVNREEWFKRETVKYRGPGPQG